ncbi:hypothetical protein BX285_1418 [Streptomyces sp. 1114.5]|uniref:nuclear transport factor 2 family protein n=1 Tax=unclassified Streptomyces TaxID=2593676 RepID=UPI000BC5EED2|nr:MULTISPECIES: nuclear transport factor 2 family protein [unclassified Streptomyces]RKT17054.1 hypothetical protein BX285_1418 [Streptomyces sp. 1114.5]SOB83265.1 hypothetical protein SAMN06272789_3467 [Streptomyces sp. 1331.2]
MSDPFAALHPVFRRQIQAMMANDRDLLMTCYHPEVKSLRFQGVLEGREAISDLLDKYDELNPEFVEVLEYVHSDDQIMTRTVLRIKGEEIVAVGSYVVKDDMIWRQFGCDEGGVRDWWA